MFKGLLVGAVLTFTVSLVLGSQGSRGSFLNIHGMAVLDFHVWWSWPLFFASSGIAWGIATMMK
ncbi:MAG TPA: hypothetical protein VGA34_12605 [Alteraurantiacibacter sp.]